LSALSPAPGDVDPTPRRAPEKRLAALEASAPDFELLFRSAPSLLMALDPTPDFRIVAASDAYLRAARFSRDVAIGQPFFDVFPENSEGPRTTGARSLRAALERVLATGKPDALNTPVFGAEGRLRYVIHRVDAMELEVLRSVRERDDALARLKSATEELDAFVHSAGQARAGSGANRMETIIDGLLGLSRVGRMHMARRRVDLSQTARRAVARLCAREPERAVKVDIAGGLEAWADEALVAIVLDNVIGNAWKYTRRRPDARIEMGARKSAGQTVFFVRDNGVGFDMARAGRLFTPFVRLHEAAEFEGHGIGLTSAKRIVERHGGEMWAEAREGEGATVHFSLGPAAG
jgi:signal transduction histidine kinase